MVTLTATGITTAQPAPIRHDIKILLISVGPEVFFIRNTNPIAL
jgi:hypothetical protein